MINGPRVPATVGLPPTLAPSSSGLGRSPLKAEIAGSNPAGATSYSNRPEVGATITGPKFIACDRGSDFSASPSGSWPAASGLVVLDEASSGLNPDTERLLDGAIANLLRGRTAILVAHCLHG